MTQWIYGLSKQQHANANSLFKTITLRPDEMNDFLKNKDEIGLGDIPRCSFSSFMFDIRQANVFSLHRATSDRKIVLYNLKHGPHLELLEFSAC